MAFRRILFLFLVSLLWAAPGAGDATAASSEWWKSEQVAVRLVAASSAVGRAEKLRLGIHFRMQPGWKVYWRSPGDAGFPPRPNWAGSKNMAQAEIDWPAPQRFEVLGFQTLGYKKEIVLPIDVRLFEPGRPLGLKSEIRFLTCADICIPYVAKLALNLPAGPETSTAEQALIERFAARVPHKGALAGLTLGRVYVSGSPGSQSLLVDVTADRALSAPDLFIEGPGELSFGPPSLRIGGDGRQALIRITATALRGEARDITGQELTLTLVDGDRAIERRVRLARVPPGLMADPPPPAEAPRYLLVMMLAFALLGGLILNLMPCVLPVLSIKLLSVLGHGGGNPAGVRRGFLASAAGILFSFLVLGSVAIGLKAAGLAAGWGIQFQQPLFLVAMVAVLMLFSANMWGLFEFRLPGRMGDLLAGKGSDKGLAGHFLTGAFATLLATPCSAPFLGTAVGFALSRTAFEIYAVFAALGVGLALPYLVIAAAPALVTKLPKPGHWMITLRRVLGFALLATALWLLTVLAAQSGRVAAGMVGVLMTACLVAIWQLSGISLRARRVSWGIVGVLILFSMLSIQNFSAATESGGPDAASEAGIWKKFDRDMIAAEVRLGRVVFVDVTADWCITCQVNKALVIRRSPVAERLRGPEVTAMKADWTRPDKRIADFLAHFGRYGIPFNVVFGPGAPEGIPLPEILTKRMVMSVIHQAADRGKIVRHGTTVAR